MHDTRHITASAFGVAQENIQLVSRTSAGPSVGVALCVTRQTLCRPDWDGSLQLLVGVAAGNVQSLVGAPVSFVEFKQLSGVAAIDAARAQLNARLANRGGSSPQLVVRLWKHRSLHTRPMVLVRTPCSSSACRTQHASGTVRHMCTHVPSGWPQRAVLSRA